MYVALVSTLGNGSAIVRPVAAPLPEFVTVTVYVILLPRSTVPVTLPTLEPPRLSLVVIWRSAILTCSAAELLGASPVSLESSATIDSDRVVVTVLVVEKVTDCKAVWYWAGVAEPLRVSTPAE